MLRSLTFGIVFFLGCLTMAGVLWYHSRADDAVSAYFKRYHVRPLEISYQTAQKPFFGGGVLLYQVHFPGILFPHKADKAHISADKDGRLVMMLHNFSFDVVAAARILHKEKIEQIMRGYMPYEDVSAYPFESLLLAGIRQIKGDLRLTFVPMGSQTRLIGHFMNRDEEVSFKILLDHVPSSDIFGFVNGQIKEVQIRVDKSLIVRDYVAYARKIGIPPSELAEKIISGSHEPFFIEQTGRKLKDIFLPH